mgnify:CR=1 FL=1
MIEFTPAILGRVQLITTLPIPLSGDIETLVPAIMLSTPGAIFGRTIGGLRVV